MCGIAGLFSRETVDANSCEEIADKVQKVMYHRGPDNWDRWFNSNVLLVHRRLRIIDLSENASQPFLSQCGLYRIVFNGEIYNYKELKLDLISRGLKFSTVSDTEVLLQMYIHYGRDCVKHLNGIFAFAIWNDTDQSLFIARDHYGIKPLYYSFDGYRFCFASEIKGLFELGIVAQIDKANAGEQIMFGYVAGQKTIFKDVKRLLPGNYLELSLLDFNLIVDEYFDLTKNKKDGIQVDELPSLTLKYLDQAVSRQLISDVPVGFMCSGGIDSSAISAIAASKYSSSIDTYCVKVPVNGFDESEFAKIVARHCKSNHFEIDAKVDDFLDLLTTLIWAHDEPLKHPNSILIFQITRLARERVTVLLSGEGSDEIFAGYWIYQYLNQIVWMNRNINHSILNLLKRLSQSLGRQAKMLFSASAPDLQSLYLYRHASVDPGIVLPVLDKLGVDMQQRINLYEKSRRGGGDDHIQTMLYFDQQIHLTSLLDRQDKMSMANSIEGRVPFLDIDMVGLANSIPSKLKVNSSDSKVILKKALNSILPEEIFNRQKYPFSVPLADWSNSSLRFKKALLALSTGELVNTGILESSYVERLLNNFFNGQHGLADLIWNILNLELTLQIFVTKELKPDLKQLYSYNM